MAGYADGTGGFTNNGIDTEENSSELCNNKNVNFSIELIINNVIYIMIIVI